MSPIVNQILDELRGAWRFRWYAMCAAWGVCVLGWLYVLSLPDVYRAEARVFVDTATAVSSLVKGLTVEASVSSQLSFVRQAMLGRPALQKVARATDLDINASTPEALQAVIDGLAARTTVEMQTGGRGATDSLYTIAYRDNEREKSIEVVDTMLRYFVEDTLGGKRSGSEAAQQFISKQLKDYERRLSESESRLAEFKKKNVGLMPGESGDYFARLQAEMDSGRVLRDQLSVAVSRRDELKRQLSGEQAYLPATARDTNGEGADTATRLQGARKNLDTLLLSYTEKHPDVIALRETIAQLESRQQAELAALRSGDPSAALSGASANPVHQQIQLQLNDSNVQVAALQRQIQDAQGRVAELRRLVDTVPEVEAEFARLNRDYDVTRAQYAALLDRLEKARLGEEAEETGAVRFEVIDPANAALEPVEPNRPRLLIMVLITGLAIGGGVAYGLHVLKPVFNNTRTLGEMTGLPVLGAVSMTWLERQRAQLRRGYLFYSLSATALVLLGIAVLIFQHSGVQLMRSLTG